MTTKKQARRYLEDAERIARKGQKRRYLLGAVGIRNDGVVVSAKNSSAVDRSPQAHAEARLAKKLTPGSIVFVARGRRDEDGVGIAKPCESCERILRSAGVVRVYYTTEDGFDFMDL